MFGAVDIGGTKTLVAVFDKDGNIVSRSKFETSQDYEEFKSRLAAAVTGFGVDNFHRAVVAAPGMIDRKHGIGLRFGNLPWKNVPIQVDAEAVFLCPTAVENDANLAALSEAIALKTEYNKVLYLTISTGIGGGIVINGIIDGDFQDIEPGQMVLENQGQFEKWENFASGSAIVKQFGKRASEIDDPQIWDIIARNIAVGLNTLIASLDPEIIVIGGGVGSHFEKFQDQLNARLKIYENPMTPIPPIRKALRPEEAVIYGCYELAKAQSKAKYGTLAPKP